MPKPEIETRPSSEATRVLTRRERRKLIRQRLLAPSPAVAAVLAEAEDRWREQNRPYTLLDAIDEHRSLGLSGPCSPEEFDAAIERDFADWFDRPLKSLDKTMVVARYMALWRVREFDRARLFLRLFGALRRGAVFRHPEVDFGPDPLAFHAGEPLNLNAGGGK